MKLRIVPEPWSPGVAHHIASRAKAKLARGITSFKYGPYFVRILKNVDSQSQERRNVADHHAER